MADFKQLLKIRKRLKAHFELLFFLLITELLKEWAPLSKDFEQFVKDNHLRDVTTNEEEKNIEKFTKKITKKVFSENDLLEDHGCEISLLDLPIALLQIDPYEEAFSGQVFGEVRNKTICRLIKSIKTEQLDQKKYGDPQIRPAEVVVNVLRAHLAGFLIQLEQARSDLSDRATIKFVK